MNIAHGSVCSLSLCFAALLYTVVTLRALVCTYIGPTSRGPCTVLSEAKLAYRQHTKLPTCGAHGERAIGRASERERALSCSLSLPPQLARRRAHAVCAGALLIPFRLRAVYFLYSPAAGRPLARILAAALWKTHTPLASRDTRTIAISRAFGFFLHQVVGSSSTSPLVRATSDIAAVPAMP